MASVKYSLDHFAAERPGVLDFQEPDGFVFSLERMNPQGRIARLRANLTRSIINPLYAFSRRFKPILPAGGLLHVTRAEQVREILLRPKDFHNPFGPEMKELGSGATFLLGVNDESHARLNAALRKALLPEDLPRIAQMAKQFASSLLDNSRGEIDVVDDLLKRVPSEICLRYFGLNCPDPDLFGDWTIAISALLFGDPYGDPTVRELAMHAGKRLTAVIDEAIVQHSRHLHKGSTVLAERETLVERLLMLAQAGELSLDDVRAMLMGLAAGFVPTNTLAGANMLVELLNRPNAMKIARKAALDADSETMRLCLLEAGRLNPALAPGQWRYCPHDTQIEVDGKLQSIPAGSTLLVSTKSALRDPREWEDPKTFRIDRMGADGKPQMPDLIFGVGPHRCLGDHLAIQITSALLTELFRREGLRRAPGKAGKLSFAGPFPRHLTLRYNSPEAEQSMYLVVAPVTSGKERAQIDALLGKLGHPVDQQVKVAFDASGVLHFASLATLESERGLDIVFELSCDGSVDSSLAAVAAAAGDHLRPVFAEAGLAKGQDLYAFLREHVVELHGKIWGATGLNFNGLGEFSVAKVERDAAFAEFSDRVLRDYVATETYRGSHPSLTLQHLRRVLRGDPALRAQATPNQIAMMDEARAKGFDALHLSTDAMRLQLSKFREYDSWGPRITRFLASRDGLWITVPMALSVVVSTIVAWFAMGGSTLSKALLAPFVGLLSGVAFLSVLLGLFVWLLRRYESREAVSEDRASAERMHTIMAAENHPGYTQNHIMAVGKLKKGAFRTFLHALALWGIKIVLTYAIRPGFVWNMGTIHYARWWRLPGTRTVAFYSNFDGSWENYLEDFITRAHEGQTAAWSNWEGFPETRFLAFGGASDSDKFKQFTRTVQQIAPFWYARFPEFSSDEIRNSALIRVGAGLARTSTEAEEWTRCFSSMPRAENLVETDEVQALVLRGMKRLPYSASLAIALPPAGEALGEWLHWIRGRPMAMAGQADSDGGGQIASLLEQGVLTAVPRGDGQEAEYALAHSLCIAFGDRPLLGCDDDSDPADCNRAMGQAAFIGLSAAGLAKFKPANAPADAMLDRLPFPFRAGMAGRAKINGDFAEDAPDAWRWHDDPDRAEATEAVLLLYASTPAALARMLSLHVNLLENHGGRVLQRTDCAPAFPDKERVDFEHFGFRDGISQPVMRGTTRSTRGVPDRDIVEPGEFIMGYRNDSGFFPESPSLPSDADLGGALPVVSEDKPSRFTDFGDTAFVDAPRDLGRNGSFLVLRELSQDVEGFERDTQRAADQLNQHGFADLYRLVGQQPDAEWVAAKMMGRWRDGRPLVGNPVAACPAHASLERFKENDFSYASDDPQGLACPFGSHVRRTNPRDSKNPDDDEEQDITNRHRILRRGRPYRREDGEVGLLFGCLVTDIERQFEFVQQIWANAPSFHGLSNEPDPIIGSDPVSTQKGKVRPRHFSIPTPAGPVKIEGMRKHVQMKGGGYFFIPSRSALSWLSDAALRQALASTKDNQTNG